MIKALLFDISGVLYMDEQPIDGAVDIINQLQRQNIPLCFVTNTSRTTQLKIVHTLKTMGFIVRTEQVFSAPVAVKKTLQQRHLTPFCLIHPQLEPEFDCFDQHDFNAVFVADAAERFDYDHLNKAFELLIEGAPLFGVGRNRYFRSNGKLSLDAGPFIQALEYAAGIEAEIIGKPSANFFKAAIAELGVTEEEVLMIGDDVFSDVLAATDLGIQSCLVKTGKYQQGDENQLEGTTAVVADSVVKAVSQYASELLI